MKLKPFCFLLFLVVMLQSGAETIYAAEGEKQLARSVGDRKDGFSDAVVVDDVPLVHTGQVLPFPLKSGIEDDLEKQVELATKNLDEALKAAGSDLKSVVKVNVYVTRNEDAQKVKGFLAAKFKGGVKPAVSFVTGKLSDANARVAMDAIGIVPVKSGPNVAKRLIANAKLGNAVAIMPSGGKYYVSGQAKNGALPEATRNTLISLEETLKFLGLGKSNVVQLKAFVQPISDTGLVKSEVASFFSGDVPPFVYVEWSSPTNTPIEIELIAADGKPQATEGDSVEFLTPPNVSTSKVYSRVAHVRRGQTIYISGLYGMKATDGAGQVREILDRMKVLAAEAGSDFDHLVKATYYVSDKEASGKLNDIRPEYYNPQRPPTASKAMVEGVGMPGKTITIDMIAVTK